MASSYFLLHLQNRLLKTITSLQVLFSQRKKLLPLPHWWHILPYQSIPQYAWPPLPIKGSVMALLLKIHHWIGRSPLYHTKHKPCSLPLHIRFRPESSFEENQLILPHSYLWNILQELLIVDDPRFLHESKQHQFLPVALGIQVLLELLYFDQKKKKPYRLLLSYLLYGLVLFSVYFLHDAHLCPNDLFHRHPCQCHIQVFLQSCVLQKVLILHFCGHLPSHFHFRLFYI